MTAVKAQQEHELISPNTVFSIQALGKLSLPLFSSSSPIPISFGFVE